MPVPSTIRAARGASVRAPSPGSMVRAPSPGSVQRNINALSSTLTGLQRLHSSAVGSASVQAQPLGSPPVRVSSAVPAAASIAGSVSAAAAPVVAPMQLPVKSLLSWVPSEPHLVESAANSAQSADTFTTNASSDARVATRRANAEMLAECNANVEMLARAVMDAEAALSTDTRTDSGTSTARSARSGHRVEPAAVATPIPDWRAQGKFNSQQEELLPRAAPLTRGAEFWSVGRDGRDTELLRQLGEMECQLGVGYRPQTGTEAAQVLPSELVGSETGSDGEILRLRAQMEDQVRQVAEERRAWDEERAWLYNELRSVRESADRRATAPQAVETGGQSVGLIGSRLTAASEQVTPEMVRDRLHVKGMSGVVTTHVDGLPTFGDRSAEPTLQPQPIPVDSEAWSMASESGSDFTLPTNGSGSRDPELTRLKKNIKAAMEAMGRMENHKDLGSVVRELSNGCALSAAAAPSVPVPPVRIVTAEQLRSRSQSSQYNRPNGPSETSTQSTGARQSQYVYAHEQRQRLQVDQSGRRRAELEASEADARGLLETRRRLDELFAEASNAADRLFAGEASTVKEVGVSSYNVAASLMQKSGHKTDADRVTPGDSQSEEVLRAHERASPVPQITLSGSAENAAGRTSSSSIPASNGLPSDGRQGRLEVIRKPQAVAAVPSPEVAAWDREAAVAARGLPSFCIPEGLTGPTAWTSAACAGACAGSTMSHGNFSSSAGSMTDGSSHTSPVMSVAADSLAPSAGGSLAGSMSTMPTNEGMPDEESRRLVKDELEKLRAWYRSLK